MYRVRLATDIARRAAATLVLMLAVPLAGCGSTQVMTDGMATWRGAGVEQVIGQWGYPDEDKTVAGHHLLVWHRNSSFYAPRYDNSTVWVNGRFVDVTATVWDRIPTSCTRILEIDRANRVIAWEWKGNDCCTSLGSGWCARLARPGVPLPARQ